MTSKARGCQRRIIHYINDYLNFTYIQYLVYYMIKMVWKSSQLNVVRRRKIKKKHIIAWINRLFD